MDKRAAPISDHLRAALRGLYASAEQAIEERPLTRPEIAELGGYLELWGAILQAETIPRSWVDRLLFSVLRADPARYNEVSALVSHGSN